LRIEVSTTSLKTGVAYDNQGYLANTHNAEIDPEGNDPLTPFTVIHHVVIHHVG
jgi:hypothetical protein